MMNELLFDLNKYLGCRHSDIVKSVVTMGDLFKE